MYVESLGKALKSIAIIIIFGNRNKLILIFFTANSQINSLSKKFLHSWSKN